MPVVNGRIYGNGFNQPLTRYVAYSGPNFLNPDVQIVLSGDGYRHLVTVLGFFFHLPQDRVEEALAAAAHQIASQELRTVEEFIELAAVECAALAPTDIEA